MTFSDDPAVRDEFEAMLAEVGRIGEALREARDQEYIVSFKTALEKLGITAAEGMTELEAASEFLRRIEEASGTIEKFRSSLETGPWDWGNHRFDDRDNSGRQWQLARLFIASANALSGLIQAHWLTGDSDGAWRDWETMRLLAHRMGEAPSVLGTMVEQGLQGMWVRTVGTGLLLGGRTDIQLASIPETLGAFNALGSLHRGIAAEKVKLEEFAQRPVDVRAFISGSDGGDLRENRGFGSMLRSLVINSATDQQIKNNLALFSADYDYTMARFDLEKRVYLPAEPGELKPSVELGARPSSLTGFYLLPFVYLGKYKEASLANISEAISSQVGSDQARFAAALESQRRAMGQYPDTLGAVSSSFPNGMPHDVATGQPYLYERTPDGYKLWSTGIDQTDDHGDVTKDILFALPKIGPP